MTSSSGVCGVASEWLRGLGTEGGVGPASAARREVAPRGGEEEEVLLESLSLRRSVPIKGCETHRLILSIDLALTKCPCAFPSSSPFRPMSTFCLLKYPSPARGCEPIGGGIPSKMDFEGGGVEGRPERLKDCD